MNSGLKQELIEQIKDKNDIVQVISEYVSLKRTGRSLVGLCPFHSEKTPSFNVNQGKQFFYCFGCGTGGDVFSFIMKLENLDFIEAAKILADRAGIVWPEFKKTDSEVERRRMELFKINQLAAAVFNQYLVKTDLGKSARDYFKKRNIEVESWSRFKLGYAPPGWHNLTEVLRKKSISLEAAEKLGLVSLGENGFYDRFRERIIFPITDLKGNIVGFGGRVMNDSQPKYLNSPETEIFHKGHFLFGLSSARDAIRKQNQAIIVEGYLDVIQAQQAGFNNTVASLGTALTKEQARLIKKFTSEVVLAYDADSAGQKATIRGMELLQEAELNVKILKMPVGDDPDSFIKKNGAEAFSRLIEGALNLADFKLQQVIKEFNLNTPEGKIQAVQAVLPEIASLDNISREFYLRQLARETGITEVTVFAEFKEWLKRNRKKSPVLDRNLNNSYTKETNEKIEITIGSVRIDELPPSKRAIFETEKELLQLALQEYDKFERIKEELKVDEFSFQIWRELFLELQRVEPFVENSRIALAEIQGPFREVAASLIAEQEIKEAQSDLAACIQRLKMLHLREKVQSLTNQLTSGRDEEGKVLSDSDLKVKAKEFTELKRRLQKEYPQFSTGI